MAYCRVDGVPTYRDSDIMALYERMEADGTDALIFSGSDVENRQSFLAAMQTTSRLWVVVADPRSRPIGCAWLNRFRGAMAEGNFCFFSDVWGAAALPAIGRWVAQRLLRLTDAGGEYMFNLLYGLTRADNRAALAFIRLAGGQIVGVLPGALRGDGPGGVDAVLSYFVRQEGEYEDIYKVRH